MPGRRKQEIEKADRTHQAASIVLGPAGNGPAVIPEPPPDLSDEAISIWCNYWSSDVARAAEQTSDLGGLHRWILAWDEWIELRPLIRESPTVSGSMGQPVLNPIAQRLTQLEKEIERAEERFGMDPKSRLALGLLAATGKLTAEQLNQRIRARRADRGDKPADDEKFGNWQRA